jgi:hypothetical protein
MVSRLVGEKVTQNEVFCPNFSVYFVKSSPKIVATCVINKTAQSKK